MAEPAISFAVKTLGNLVIQKVDFLRGVEEEMEWVKRELQRMQTFLKDAAEKQANDDNIRQWISEIRELAKDAEDIIDTFILEIDNPRSHLYHLGKHGNEIKSIKARLEEIEISRQRYKIENIQGSSRRLYTSQRRRLSTWQRDKHLVGVDENVKLLLREVVLEKRKGLSTASIVGMGGIGKSTLHKVLYNHNDVADRFERRAWVVVSQQFNHTETIKELVLHMLEPNEDKLKVLELIEKSPAGHLNSIVYERLKGRPFLLLLTMCGDNKIGNYSQALFQMKKIRHHTCFKSRYTDVPIPNYIYTSPAT
ncbi:hypothetical protein CDL12_05645 [Handroanthus impetiginosus]|uniref:NB-ARC domain-containing protein n=1 Tax=Handroanthus impetiginosus TaxID=429701 RepID=A0A2G9HVX5_9LAMI|nr:hypothetical protein CDL12_05645 [Handroanthus impetiginosus]